MREGNRGPWGTWDWPSLLAAPALNIGRGRHRRPGSLGLRTYSSSGPYRQAILYSRSTGLQSDHVDPTTPAWSLPWLSMAHKLKSKLLISV